MKKSNEEKKYQKIEYMIILIAVLASISMIRLDPTPYSTDEMNYKDISRLLLNLKIYDKNFIHSFIKINDTYYPSQPIGYPILSLPFYALFRLENEIFSQKPQFLFSYGFYPPENDYRGTFYWIENESTIYIFSKKNDLIKFGFLSMSFVKDRELNIFYQEDSIFNNKISIYPKWYETYFPAKKGWNKLVLKSENCLNISEIKNTDDYRCVSLMIINPKFEFFVAKPYTERSESYSFRGNETFEINFTNPNVFPVKVKMNFVTKSNLNTSLKIKIENKTYSFNLYAYPTEYFTEFFELKPNETIFEFKLENCPNCFVVINRILVYSERDFYDDEFYYENGFFLEENYGNRKWRWANNEAILSIYSENNQNREIELNLFSYYREQNLKIYLNSQLIKEDKISPNPKKIKVSLDLKKGTNKIKLQADDCFIPALIEKSEDYRCLAFGIIKS